MLDKLNLRIEFVDFSDTYQIRKIVYVVLIDIQPTFQSERIGRKQDVLGIKFESECRVQRITRGSADVSSIEALISCVIDLNSFLQSTCPSRSILS